MPRARLRQKAKPLVHGTPNSREESVLKSARRCDQFTYDFSTDGDSDFSSGRLLRAGAIVKTITVDVLTAVTGATDAVLKCGSDALTTATNLTLLSGVDSIATVDADGVKVSAQSELNIDFTAAPTAGKIRVFVEYLEANE